MMRIVMVPSLKVSPALAGTKLMETWGVGSPAGGFSWVAMVYECDVLYKEQFWLLDGVCE